MQRTQGVLGALALLLVVGLVLLLLGRFAPGGGTGTPTATPVPPSASVAAFQGAAFACPQAPAGDCAMPASVGQPVFAGGEVRTGESGTADVQTRTTVFRLGNSTALRFRDVSDAVTQVVLAVGRLFASHDPGGRTVVRVQVGQVTVQAIDTRFSIETQANGRVYVAVPPGGGQVTILMGAAASVPLGAGQEVVISSNISAPLAPQPLSAAEQARWAAVSCAWQGITDRLTPVALPTAPCAPPTSSPRPVAPPPTIPPRPRATATPLPPTEPPLPPAPTDTPAPPPPPGEGSPSPTSTPPGANAPTPTSTALSGRLITDYLATWLNADAVIAVPTAAPPKLALTNKGPTLIVQWFTVCAPHLCDNGSTSAPFSGEPFSALSPEGRKVRITLEKGGTVLILDDPEGRATYSYRRVAARDYTGTWINDDAGSQVFPRVTIRNSGGKIIVDWTSSCFGAACTSSGPFGPEPLVTDRFALHLDNAAGTRLQLDDLRENVTYYFHK